MEIWTDGTTIVQACVTAGEIRVFRSGACVGKTTPERPLPWKTPLAVDPAADRIWAGRHADTYRFADASPWEAGGDVVLRLAALGDGRLAAVLPPRAGSEACRLAVGLPGAWEREVVLADLHDIRDPGVGMAMTGDRPVSREVGGDPTLTATAHGIVVADGQRGVVAHFDTGLDLVGLWYAGGVDETELLGYATAHGVLATARWAARDTLVFRLTPDGPRKLLADYGAFAMPADDDRIWVVGTFDVNLLDADGTAIAKASGPRGLVQAAHAAGTHCAIGTTTTVTTLVAAADGITTTATPVEELTDVFAVFPSEPTETTRLSAAVSQHNHSYGYSSHEGPTGTHHIVVPQVRPGRDADVANALHAAGAIVVETHPHHDGAPRRPCCEGPLAL